MATIDIRAVRKTYPGGGGEVIKGIDLAVGDGELLVLLGPSGCGKSTLLRMVAGLERISRGEIAIAGRVVNDLEPRDRNIAMVFQNYALYPHMTVYANMAYGLRIQRLSRTEIDRRVRAAAEILELQAFLKRKPRALSGGQRQRVAMGRAIVREPDVFLFDEPLSNLDAKLRTQMRVAIKRLQQRLATTSLYVTHDQAEAMTLADRLMVMRDGVAEQIDTPMAVYERPASVFVGGFIGAPAMNFLDGAIVEGGRVALPGGLMLPADPAAGDQVGRPVTVGIRPEKLVPAADAAGAGGLRCALTVDLAEALGADTLVHGRIAGTAAPLIARLAGHARPRPGDTLALVAADGAWHRFDAASGRRLAGAADRLSQPAA